MLALLRGPTSDAEGQRILSENAGNKKSMIVE